MDHSGLDGELINSPLACWDSKRAGGRGRVKLFISVSEGRGGTLPAPVAS